MIRVSTNMLFMDATRNINQNQRRYLEIQESLVTNRKINRPSDDPVGAARASDIHRYLDSLDQYDRNITQSNTFLSNSEEALSAAKDALDRAKELAVDINGGISSPGNYQSAATEVQNLKEMVLEAANRKIGDRYLFGGYATTTQPFDSSGNYSGGSNQDIEVEIGNNQYVVINQCGDDIFVNGTNIFQVFDNLISALNAGDQTAISNQLPELDKGINQLLQHVADIGSRENKVESAQENVDSLRSSYTSLVSDIEDADVVSATAEFTKQEQVYQATLEVSSRILSTSFLDFIK